MPRRSVTRLPQVLPALLAILQSTRPYKPVVNDRRGKLSYILQIDVTRHQRSVINTNVIWELYIVRVLYTKSVTHTLALCIYYSICWRIIVWLKWSTTELYGYTTRVHTVTRLDRYSLNRYWNFAAWSLRNQSIILTDIIEWQDVTASKWWRVVNISIVRKCNLSKAWEFTKNNANFLLCILTIH